MQSLICTQSFWKKIYSRLRATIPSFGFIIIIFHGVVGCAGPGNGNKVGELRQTAELGNPDAQYKLGRYYDSGRRTWPNHHEAVKWFRRSAEQGFTAAQYQLGVCYFEGKGVEMEAISHVATHGGY
jgi:hypothetical protein